tara:strand:+ start:7161 stop:7898 length:738 start_codon:yes stop_codon:yes gene_type:complete
MNTESIISKLKDDKAYYGEFGKKFLSFSDIRYLLRDPRTFRQPSEPTLPMLMGSYLHTKLLEPNRLTEFPLVPSSSRNTNIYKGAVADMGASMLLLEKEAEELDFLCGCITQNFKFCALLYDDANKYEQPGLTTINGKVWKGKADVVCTDRIIDLKTCADLDGFEYSAKRYNYDCQAFLYQHIFDLPMQFMVVEKKSGRTALCDCTPEFLASGEEKVLKALDVYNKFFGENATEDVTQFFIYKQL